MSRSFYCSNGRPLDPHQVAAGQTGHPETTPAPRGCSRTTRGVTARWGSVAQHRLSCALDALAVLGQPAPAGLVDDSMFALLRRLTEPGNAPRWMAKFAPFVAADARLGTCSPSPWAHVRMRQRDALRQGYAALLAERVARSAPPRRLPPPPVEPAAGSDIVPVPNGCLLCGVSNQVVPAVRIAQAGSAQQAARDVWIARRCTGQSIGAPGPQRLAGHVCLACDAALERAGAMGPTALERAVVTYLQPGLAGQLPYGVLELTGVVGWAALVVQAHQPGSAPPATNEAPWAHLGSLDRLTEQLKVLQS